MPLFLQRELVLQIDLFRNWMKTQIWIENACSPTPTLHGMGININFFPGIAWYVQICTEKSCFPNPTPHVVGWINLQKKNFFYKFNKMAWPTKKSSLPTPSHVGWGIKLQNKTFLQGIEWNVKICTEILFTLTPNTILTPLEVGLANMIVLCRSKSIN